MGQNQVIASAMLEKMVSFETDLLRVFFEHSLQAPEMVELVHNELEN